jgi:hypothetical protein
LSTRGTIYKKIFADGEEIHVFEELGCNSPEGPGFYVYIFVPYVGDILVKTTEDKMADFLKKL